MVGLREGGTRGRRAGGSGRARSRVVSRPNFETSGMAVSYGVHPHTAAFGVVKGVNGRTTAHRTKLRRERARVKRLGRSSRDVVRREYGRRSGPRKLRVFADDERSRR